VNIAYDCPFHRGLLIARLRWLTTGQVAREWEFSSANSVI
jgi:hypothetical protein